MSCINGCMVKSNPVISLVPYVKEIMKKVSTQIFMLKHPTLTLEDEEGSRLELLLVWGQSTRGILKLEGAIWKFGDSKQLLLGHRP